MQLVVCVMFPIKSTSEHVQSQLNTLAEAVMPVYILHGIGSGYSFSTGFVAFLLPRQ
jgi:hypothetical protein